MLSVILAASMLVSFGLSYAIGHRKGIDAAVIVPGVVGMIAAFQAGSGAVLVIIAIFITTLVLSAVKMLRETGHKGYNLRQGLILWLAASANAIVFIDIPAYITVVVTMLALIVSRSVVRSVRRRVKIGGES